MPIKVNIPKAKEIVKAQIRVERAPLLESLDVQMLRAIEQGDAVRQAEIAAEKQALRDATKSPLIEAAATVEELKAITLEAIVNGG